MTNLTQEEREEIELIILRCVHDPDWTVEKSLPVAYELVDKILEDRSTRTALNIVTNDIKHVLKGQLSETEEWKHIKMSISFHHSKKGDTDLFDNLAIWSRFLTEEGILEERDGKKKQILLDKLSICGHTEPEGGHIQADNALLRYIDDKDITNAYEKIEKWYS